MESDRFLSRSLRSHACNNELDLAHCDLGSSPEILLVVLQSDVKYINLGNNNIDSLGAVTITKRGLDFQNLASSSEPNSTELATQRAARILDANYSKADLPAVVRTCTHLTFRCLSFERDPRIVPSPR
jgi:hypothetical protein